jgi:dimethylargininase
MREVAASSDRRNPAGGARAAIDIELARSQHGELVRVLEKVGAKVKFAPRLADNPRSALIEEAVVVLPEMGILARPQDSSQATDTETMVPLLAQHRPIQRIVDPALLDGRDVLRIGRTLFVVPTATTNAEGIADLRAIVEPFGYDVREVELRGCPHLKLAASFVHPHFLILNPAWADPKQFGDLVVLGVDEREPLAASTLPVNGTTLVSDAFPKTERRLRNAGITTRRVAVSELHKMEAGLSSLAVIVEPRTVRSAGSPVGFRVVQAGTAPVASELFAPAIVHGGVVYVSRQLPIDPATGRAVEGEIEDQTNQVLRNLSDVLSASGSSLGRVLRLTCYVADTKHVDRVTAACALALTGHKPAGSVVAARTLHPGCAIAVDAIAAVTDER